VTISNRDRYWINYLTEKIIGTNTTNLRCKHAACVVYKNKVLSIGLNKDKSHPLQYRYSQSQKKIAIHAEIDAIKGLYLKNPSKSILYVARINNKDSSYALSKPCGICDRVIKEFQIKRVVFTGNRSIEEKIYF